MNPLNRNTHARTRTLQSSYTFQYLNILMANGLHPSSATRVNSFLHIYIYIYIYRRILSRYLACSGASMQQVAHHPRLYSVNWGGGQQEGAVLKVGTLGMPHLRSSHLCFLATISNSLYTAVGTHRAKLIRECKLR